MLCKPVHSYLEQQILGGKKVLPSRAEFEWKMKRPMLRRQRKFQLVQNHNYSDVRLFVSSDKLGNIIFAVKYFSTFAAEHRLALCYAFGLLCLASWLAFNLWVLRDYFFPWWFPPIYTETGLRREKLETKKRQILMRTRMSNAFQLPASIGAGRSALKIAEKREKRRQECMQAQRLRAQQHRHSIAVFTLDAWNRC